MRFPNSKITYDSLLWTIFMQKAKELNTISYRPKRHYSQKPEISSSFFFHSASQDFMVFNDVPSLP